MPSRSLPRFALLAMCLALAPGAHAEIPLPPHIVFGRLAEDAEIVAVVERGNLEDLTVTGEVTEHSGELFYVLRVPIETDIGAPGPSGEAARVGDRLLSLDVDGVPLAPAQFPLTLATAEITQIDFVITDPVDFVRSDCNADGLHDIGDPLRLLLYLYAGATIPPCLKACDVDASGRLDNTDAIRTLQFLFLGGDAPPAPFPGCSQDGSALSCVRYDACPEGKGLGGQKGAGWLVKAPKEPDRDLDVAALLGGAGAAGGAPVVAALANDLRRRRDRDDERSDERGRLEFGVFDPGLEVTPTTLRFDRNEESDGDSSLESGEGQPQRREVVLTNRSRHPFDLELVSRTAAFDVEPQRVELAPEQSASAWVLASERDRDEASIPAPDELPAIEVTDSTSVLARLEIVADSAAADRRCRERVAAATESDLVVVLRHLYRGEAAPECLEHFDRDGDGTVNMNDVVAALAARLGS